MRDLNIDFMDLYKRTDRFIKDAYSSSEGVSEYIRLMEVSFYRGSADIRGWKSDYDKLKHIRWIRNQLAHEVSYDSDICSLVDYEWLEDFYESLFSATDPLARLRKAEDYAKSNKPKPAAASRPQQSQRAASSQQSQSFDLSCEYRPQQLPEAESPPPRNMQQKPDVNQFSGCLVGGVLTIMLILLIVLVVSHVIPL